MAIDLSILEKEDALKNLPDMALQQMLRQPSPNAPPFLVAAELKRREEMAKEFAGKQAAAQTAQQAPTVAHRLAGQQQPMPMSQAGAMAAPPQQPPMPQEAQLAMALSGATGRPPPQLPTVNAARGYRGSAPRQSASSSDAAMKAIMDELEKAGTGTYSQMPTQKPFSSERPPPAGLLRLAVMKALADKAKQERETSSARGGFVRRPVTAANGTQGRTVYAQDGFRFSPEEVLDVERTGVPPWVQQEVLRRQQDWAESPGLGVDDSIQAEMEKLRADWRQSQADWSQFGPAAGILANFERERLERGGAAVEAVPEFPVSTTTSERPGQIPRPSEGMRNIYGQYGEGMPGPDEGERAADPRDEFIKRVDRFFSESDSPEDTRKRLWDLPVDFLKGIVTEWGPRVATKEDMARRDEAAKVWAQKRDAEAVREIAGASFAGEGPPLPRADPIRDAVSAAGPGVQPWPIPYRSPLDQAVTERVVTETPIRQTGGDAGVAERAYPGLEGLLPYINNRLRIAAARPGAKQAAPAVSPDQDGQRGDNFVSLDEALASAGIVSQGTFPDQVEINQREGGVPIYPHGGTVVPIQPSVSDDRQVVPPPAAVEQRVESDQLQEMVRADREKVDPVDGQSEFASWWDRTQKESAAADSRDNRSAAQVWWDDWQARSRAQSKEARDLRGRRDFLDRFRSDIGRPGSVLGWFTRTPQERQQGLLVQQEFESVRPLLESDPVLFGRFGEDPQAFIEDRLAQKAAAKTMLSKDAVGPTVLAEKSVPVDGVTAEFVTETVTEKAKPSRREEAAALAQWPTNISPTGPDDKVLVGGEDKGSFQRTSAALRGRLTALEDQKADDITGQATQFFNTLTEANKDVYSNLEDGLKEFRKADAKDFEKLEARFKALDDFYETGKLPERMRQDRITNLMLEMSKGLLGNQDLYSGFKAGLEGFQAVDKAARDEYAKGLAARLTASKGIIDSKMAMRNSRRQEAIAMTKFAAAENRGNAALAMEQLKIAQQAKQNERTHQINLIRGEATILSADASMAAAMKGTKEERLLKSLPRDMYAGALAKAKDGNRTELDTYYRRDSQGNVHANMPAFIALVNKLGSTGYGAIQSASYLDRAKRQFQSDVASSVKALKGEWTKTNAPQWAAIARSIGLTPPTGPLEFDKIRDRLVPAAEKFYAAKIATQIQHATPGMPDWIARTYGLGGAAQGGKRDPAGVRSALTGATN